MTKAKPTATKPSAQPAPEKRARPKAPARVFDLSELSLTDDPYTGRVTRDGSKYDAIFAAMQPGQRLRCPGYAAGRLGSELRKWLQRRGKLKGLVVKSLTHCGDGWGGVWVLPQDKDKPVQTVWQVLAK